MGTTAKNTEHKYRIQLTCHVDPLEVLWLNVEASTANIRPLKTSGSATDRFIIVPPRV